jgi:ABC-type nitrate/sulfonate/bicarbonate transport system ATPase subunit
VLEVEVVQKCYADRGGRRHVALQDLRLTAAAGEFVCLVGPSGCGKSTLLNIIDGLDTAVDARVRFAGTASAALAGTASPGPAGTASGDLPGGIGFMFQEARLMPWLTVLQNVCLVLDGKVARDEAERRARELLAAMELGDVLDAYPGTLSGGMQRRVALARAFAIEPQLLLMDEPFVSLDAPTAARLRAMLIALWQRRGTTVLFVTHDLREALALADRVCFMSHAPGHIVLELPVTLPRPRQPQDAAVSRLYDDLLAAQPELLAGLAGPAVQVAERSA